jgi:hypothetical protein
LHLTHLLEREAAKESEFSNAALARIERGEPG